MRLLRRWHDPTSSARHDRLRSPALGRIASHPRGIRVGSPRPARNCARIPDRAQTRRSLGLARLRYSLGWDQRGDTFDHPPVQHTEAADPTRIDIHVEARNPPIHPFGIPSQEADQSISILYRLLDNLLASAVP